MFKVEKSNNTRKTKYTATAILFISMFSLLIFWTLSKYFPSVYLFPLFVAFFEASMVGGVADLFAIHVLFKHPFGLKIPHTAIIPSNKNRIGHAFSDFLRDNFLSKNYVKENIQKYNISEKIGFFVEKHKKIIGNKTIRLILCLFENYDQNSLKIFINNKAESLFDNINFKKYALIVLQNIKNKEQHQKIVNFSLEQLKLWLDNPENSNKVNKWIENSIKSDGKGGTTFSGTLKSMFMGKQDLSLNVKELIDKINSEEGELIRGEINKAFSSIIELIENDPIIDKSINDLKKGIIEEKYISSLIDKLIRSINDWIKNDLLSLDSKLRNTIVSIIDNIVERLKTDEKWINNIQQRSEEYLPEFIVQNGRRIDTYIVNYIEKLDADEVAQLVKDKVGDDLEYIRINGSIVGGLVGVIWFFIEKGLNLVYPMIFNITN